MLNDAETKIPNDRKKNNRKIANHRNSVTIRFAALVSDSAFSHFSQSSAVSSFARARITFPLRPFISHFIVI